jgi:hypothetical protein
MVCDVWCCQLKFSSFYGVLSIRIVLGVLLAL